MTFSVPKRVLVVLDRNFSRAQCQYLADALLAMNVGAVIVRAGDDRRVDIHCIDHLPEADKELLDKLIEDQRR